MAMGDFVSEDENSFVVEGPEGYQTIAKTPGTIKQLEKLKSSGMVSRQFAPAPSPAPMPGLLPASLEPARVSPVLPAAQPVAQDLGTSSAGYNDPYQQAAAPMGGFAPVSMNVQTPGSQTTTQQKQISPEQKKSIDLAFESQRKAVEAQMVAEQAQAKQQAEIYGAMQGEYDASYQKQNEALAAKRKVYDEQRTQFNESVKRFTESKLRDPVAEQGFASKLGAAIAVGLGAYASAKTGGPNTALQIINSSIDRAMQLQKMDIAKKGEEVNLRRNDLALLKEEMGDITQAESAYRAGLLEKAKLQVEIASAKSKNPQIQAKGAQLIAAIDAEKAKVLADFDSKVVSKVDQSGGMNVAYGMPEGLSAADRKKAKKEVLEFDSAYKSLLSSFDKAAKQGLGGAVPSVLGGKKGERQAEQAALSAAVVGKVPGIRSDADYDRIIVPLLPNPTDPDRTVKAKREALQNFFRSYAPEGWLRAQQGSGTSGAQTFQPM